MKKRKAKQRFGKSASGTADIESAGAHDLLDKDLSPRQREVVLLLAEGNTNKQIAAILNLSRRTVEAYRATIMRKLKLRSFPGLVRYAVRKLVAQLQLSEKATSASEDRDTSGGSRAVETRGTGMNALSDEFEGLQSRFKAIQRRFEKAKTSKERQQLLASSGEILSKAHVLLAELRAKALPKTHKQIDTR